MTPRRCTRLFTSLSILVLGWATPELRAQTLAPPAPARLMVIDASETALPDPFTDVDLGAEVSREVKDEGCEVVRACRVGDCPVGASVGSSERVLRFDARYDSDQFSCAVSVEVEDPNTGHLEYRESSSSPICPAAELLEHTRRAARLACAHFKTALQDRKPNRALPPITELAAGGPRAATPWLGTGLVVAGASSLAAGAVLLYLHGRHTDCAADPSGREDCTRWRNTAPVAIPLVLVGAGGLGWGIWDLSNHPAESDGTVVVGWSIRGFFVGGTY